MALWLLSGPSSLGLRILVVIAVAALVLTAPLIQELSACEDWENEANPALLKVCTLLLSRVSANVLCEELTIKHNK